MKLKTSVFILLSMTSATSLVTFAAPVKFPECAKFVRVTDIPGGYGSLLNEDCTVLYVLPPLKGVLEVNNYTPSANITGQCSRLKNIEQEANEIQDLALINIQRITRYAKEIKQIEENLSQGLVPIGESVESMEDKMDALILKIDALRAKISTWQDQVDKKKLTFAQAEGGRGVFTMESSFSEILESYKAANPRLRVVPMPIDQAYLSINEVKADKVVSTAMPAVLNLLAVGLSEIPLLLDPNILLTHKQLAPQASPVGSKIFGGSLGGEIHVSNIGACALLERLGNKSAFRASDVKSYIMPVTTYGYQVQVTRKHSIRYNFQELVRQIHETTKRGGFFSTRTLNSFIDERRTSSWITFEVSSQDTRYEYTDAYVREVKKEFIDRALSQIVSLQTGSPVALLAMIEPSKNGATTVSEDLAKCPNAYCQMSAAGLKMLSSIFGSTTATTNLLKTVSGEMSETVTEKRMVPVYGTYTFQ